MEYQLIALDLDGTLLRSDKTLSPENTAALARAAAAGAEIVPATGRFLRAVPPAVRALPFLHYMITVNGARVVELATDRTLYRAELPWERGVAVMKYLDTLPVIYDCYMDGWGWMTQSLYDRSLDFSLPSHTLALIRDFRTPVPELKAHLAQVRHGLQKVQAYFPDVAQKRRGVEELAGHFPDLELSSSSPRNVEINSKEATKGKALAALAAALKVDRSRTLAFGDDLNDVSLLQAAGRGVAMGNACPEAMTAADAITLSCDEDGVAAFLNGLDI